MSESNTEATTPAESEAVADFSVYCHITNDTNQTLDLRSFSAAWGDWVKLPKQIPAGQSGDAQLKDKIGPNGTEGEFNYAIGTSDGSPTFKSYVTCPYAGKNKVTVDQPSREYKVVWECRSSGGEWFKEWVPEDGHPVEVKYTVVRI